ncbi:MAG: cyclic pyranopterin monophosphate synthase MoaC [Thermoplasmata archaeon]
MTRQVAIDTKPIVHRRARAQGDLSLAAATVRAVRDGTVAKGDPIAVGELAGLLAAKRTPELIPHCHVISLTGSRVELRVTTRGLRAEAEIEALARTGVEMEALLAVSVALLAAWDMVKYLEKNDRGQYPTARIGGIRVVSKEKGVLPVTEP